MSQKKEPEGNYEIMINKRGGRVVHSLKYTINTKVLSELWLRYMSVTYVDY